MKVLREKIISQMYPGRTRPWFSNIVENSKCASVIFMVMYNIHKEHGTMRSKPKLLPPKEEEDSDLGGK